MKLATFQTPASKAEAGVVLDGQVIGLAAAGFPDMISVAAASAAARARLDDYLASPPATAVHALEAVRLLAPIPRPPKLICVGLNYRDHAIESGMEIPSVPTIFAKFPTAVIGPGAPVVLPRLSTKPDYEAELAFVIGEGGRYIAAGDWRRHVFGYTICNDVSARDYQLATSQWMMGKTFDTFAPIGPWIVSADEIEDPHRLGIRMTVSGDLLQDSNTREFIFQIPLLIEFLSGVFTLEPGDIVSTGTPPGVGFARKPPRFLRPGDEMVVEVEGIGELRNPVVAEQ